MSSNAFAQLEREFAEREDRLADCRDRIEAFRKTLPSWDVTKQPGRYVKAEDTDLSKTFAKARRRLLPDPFTE
jgi:hypothetical protein